MERYTPLRDLFERHKIAHEVVQHGRGSLLQVTANTENSHALSERHHKLEAAITEMAHAQVQAPETKATQLPWWKRMLGLEEKPTERPQIKTPVPDEQTSAAIKESLRGKQGVTARERVRQKLEQVAKGALPDYDIHVGMKSITHGGFVVEAREKLNGS